MLSSQPAPASRRNLSIRHFVRCLDVMQRRSANDRCSRRESPPRKADMKTALILLAQYDGMAIVPVESVCRDYFRHLTVDKFLRKVLAGEIALPVVRIESSQKAARGVHITDLAAYLDTKAEAARLECLKLCERD